MASPITVAIVNHTSRLGGAERVLLTFLKYADSSSLRPVLVCPIGPLADEAQALGVECVPFDSVSQIATTRSMVSFKNDFITTYEALRNLNSILATIRPDVVMSNSVKSHVLCSLACRRLRIPHVVRLHDHLSAFSKGARAILVLALRRAALVSCVSKSVANSVVDVLGSSKRVEVCYNGHVFADVVLSHHIEGTRVVAAGWLFPWKGFDVFIRAMEMIAGDYSEWWFTIAGGVAEDVPESRAYQELLQSMISRSRFRSRFALVGEYRSLSEILCCSGHCIFVLPSQRPDPLPTVLLEAASLKVATVATDVGGVNEIIPDEAYGITCEPTPNAIAQSVRRLIENPDIRMRMGQNFADIVRSRFGVEPYVNAITSQLVRVVRLYTSI
ncbi:MAG: glycosyltransferase family 4 protein [Alicyclobacillus sp.]|nr:glycosyltransferase family 4 protein [Alicyclobacillus sp.]